MIFYDFLIFFVVCLTSRLLLMWWNLVTTSRPFQRGKSRTEVWKKHIRNACTSWHLRLTTYIGLFQKSDQGNIVSCWRFCLHLCRSSGLCQQLFPYPFFARRSFISCLLVSKVPAGRAALSRHGGKPPFRSWKMNSVISMTPSSLSLILKSELL